MNKELIVPGKDGFKKNLLVYFCFLTISLILFLPVLDKNFASDDFVVLHRIAWQKIFFIRNFFRPLSDISLYGTYLAGGFNPLYYNVTNVILHASCAFLLFRFCMVSALVSGRNRTLFSWLAAFFFIIYPFHNEAVIWAVGRGIVLSAFFGYLSLLVVFSAPCSRKKYVLSCFFYFTGLCGYEAIIPLPCIILLFLYSRDKSIKKLILPAVAYTITLALNIVVRWLVAGVIWGGYGSAVFSSPGEYAIKFFKTAGRILLPPSQSSLVLVICTLLLAASIVFVAAVIYKRKKGVFANFSTTSSITLVSFFMPLVFGISTRTYEGDRIFYFSSFFLCIWVAYLVLLLPQKKWQLAAGFSVALYFLFFFFQSVFTWKRAGNIATGIINTVRTIQHRGTNIYLLNIPEEYHGAQVIRSGFTEALLINGIDTAGVRAINYISTGHGENESGQIQPVRRNDGLYVYPSVRIYQNIINARVRSETGINDSVSVAFRNVDRIYFWNTDSLVLLKGPL